jgi:hypothetical protein
MLLKEALLTIALTLPPPWYPPDKNPETAEEYRARLETIVEAIALESKVGQPLPEGENALAAATLVLWHGESRFELAVHTNVGKTRWGQDYGRARCLGQLHASGLVPKEEWETLAGSDLESTRRCAKATMRMLRAQYWVCRHRTGKGGRVARMYEAYATGRSCQPRQRSKTRAFRWRKTTERLWALTHAQKKDKEKRGDPTEERRQGQLLWRAPNVRRAWA